MAVDALVTGAGGFVGGALVRRLLADGRDVACLQRPGRSLPPDLTPLQRGEATFDDSGALLQQLRALRPRTVYHLAAAGIALADRDPQALFSGNVAATHALVQAAGQAGVERVVLVGSCSEYGAVASEPVTEDAPLRPTSAYGATKAAGIVLGRGLAAAGGVACVVLRPFGLFGGGEAPQRLIPHVVARLRAGHACDLTPGGQIRDFLWVEDAVTALMQADRLPDGGVFNLCSGQGRSVRSVVEAVADTLGGDRSLLRFGALPAREDEPPVLVGSPARLMAACNWQPTPFTDALAATVRTLVERSP
jgi:GDP-4-dehydro-6-deoxy-D-mannose reductase